MFVERIVSEGLAHYSYIAGDAGEAFVVDPRRDVDSYIRIARRNCSKIKFVFETHCNEDYLTGSLELEGLTDCRIIHSSLLNFGYGEPAAEGDVFDIGSMMIRVLETPGHSPESLSFELFILENPWAVFTGDVLFYGNVGRTDLSGREKSEENAQLLYNSLNGKLLPLGDGVIVYPAHGSGSVCGGSMSDIEISTIGYERASNPMLLISHDEFIERKKRENLPLPPYFPVMADHNMRGSPPLDRKRIEPMDARVFAEAMEGCVVVDTRNPLSFAGGHIKGSYNIWLSGLPIFGGWVLEYEKDILLITERPEDIKTARCYLERCGFDRVKGYLCDGIDDWIIRGMQLEHSEVYTVDDLYMKMSKENMSILDVREKEEYAGGHIPGAVNIYVGELEGQLSGIPSDRPIISVCSSGYRSGLGASILTRRGLDRVYNLVGGTTAWKEKGYPLKQEDSD